MFEIVNSFIASLAQLLFCSCSSSFMSEANNLQVEIIRSVPCRNRSSTLSVSLDTISDADTTTMTVMESLSPRSTNSFDLSLVSDTLDDDDSYDSLLCYRSFVSQRSHIPRGLGLGIYACSSENENLVFDGLGIVSRHEHGCLGSVSEIMLQEILATFAEDPFHRHSSPRRQSSPIGDVTPRLSSFQKHDHISMEFVKDLTTRTRHFSLPTISSQLKRASNFPLSKPPASQRARSASWLTMINPSQSLKSFDNRQGWRI